MIYKKFWKSKIYAINVWRKALGYNEKDFDLEVIEYVKIKIKSSKDEIRNDFHGERLQSEKTPCAKHLIVLFDSVSEVVHGFILKCF